MNRHHRQPNKPDPLRAVLEKAHGKVGLDYEKALKTAPGLTRALRRDVKMVLEARAAANHPRLFKQIDQFATQKAEQRLMSHLRSYDRDEIRKGRLLGLAGVIVFNLLVIIALLLGWIAWTTQK